MKTAFHYALALGMLITGSTNTISTKAADLVNTQSRYGTTVQFNHPFFQALCMFLGEASCLLAYYVLRARARGKGEPFAEGKPHSKLIFALPALCDMTATSLMYVGLGLTDASVFQMLRGSVVIFVGILSRLVLKRKLGAHKWTGMALVMAGAAVVGLPASVTGCAGGSSAATDASKAALGNALIVVAQVIVAVQMIVEEIFIDKYDVPPLQVVGWEGVWGLTFLSGVLVAMYYVPSPAAFCAYPPHCDHFEDAYDALVNMQHSWQLSAALGGNLLSIAFFNAIGVAITKHLSAATRMVLDSMRTLVIWAFSMGVGWEAFCWNSPVGFVVLLAGILLFNEVVRAPCFTYEAGGGGKGGEGDKDKGDAADEYALLGGAGNVDGSFDAGSIQVK